MIKYVVLFSIILVAVVLSIVLAGYFSTKNLVKDIPNQLKRDLQKMPEWKILKKLPSSLSQMIHALQLGKSTMVVKKTYPTLQSIFKYYLYNNIYINLYLFLAWNCMRSVVIYPVS